jgi:hypothetical protein
MKEWLYEFIVEVLNTHKILLSGILLILIYVFYKIGGDILNILKNINWKFATIVILIVMAGYGSINYINHSSLERIKKLEASIQIYQENQQAQTEYISNSINRIEVWTQHNDEILKSIKKLNDDINGIRKDQHKFTQKILKTKKIDSCDGAMDFILEGVKK